MILHGVTISLCVLICLFFRRLDKANMRIMKLKRFTDSSFKEFKKVVDGESRRFNDSTIEMDLLLKKAQNISGGIRTSIDDIEKRIAGLDSGRENLKKVEDELKAASIAADQVNRQVHYIESVKNNFGSFVNKINALNESMLQLEKNNGALFSQFNERLRERSQEITGELVSELQRIRESVAGSEGEIITQARDKVAELQADFTRALNAMERNVSSAGESVMQQTRVKIESMARTVSQIEQRVEGAERKVFTEIQDRVVSLEDTVASFRSEILNAKDETVSRVAVEVDQLSSRVAELKSTMSGIESNMFDEIKRESRILDEKVKDTVRDFEEQKGDLLEKAEVEVSQMFVKINNLESTLNETRARLINSFEDQTEKIKVSMDELSLHSLAKKDEIVKEAHREAEKLHKLIEDFSDKYHQAENNLNDAARDHIETLRAEYATADSRNEKAKAMYSEFENHLTELKSEIVNYEKANRIFSRTDEMMERVDKAIVEFNSTIDRSKREASELEGFISEMDEFREARRELEKELKIYSSKREKLQTISYDIQALFDIASDVKGNVELITDSQDRVSKVATKLDQVNVRFAEIDKKMESVRDFDDYIASHITSVERIEQSIAAVDKRVAGFQSLMEKSESRVNKMREYLQSVEEATHLLKTKEHEISVLKDRFNEIDSLSEYMEKRVEQIQTMIRKIENMRAEIDMTDGRLKEMFEKTDKKMQQFSQFIQSVEPDNLITKKMNPELKITPNVSDKIVKTIRELSEKGWSANDISQQLLVEENMVRFIINTSAH